MSPAAAFVRGCVASPHHLASEVGARVLADGGNALDAAVATNLTLGVVAPYLCGYGGDLFAMVWRDGLHAYNGSGRAPAAATIDQIRAHTEDMPTFGPLTVTVPGAVRGWFDLLERFGTRPFGELAAPALAFARAGFALSEAAAGAIAGAAEQIDDETWQAVYAGATPGGAFVQADLARTIERLIADGPDAFYRGPIADAVVERLRAGGSAMTMDDLAEHAGDALEPVSARYRGVDIHELPPNTQGVTALQALLIVEALDVPDHGVERDHLLIEATKRALADRAAHVGDPSAMRLSPGDLLGDARIGAHVAAIDAARASAPAPVEALGGGTAYLCAADADGMAVSLIQSNYMGFGAGVTVPGWGINLHNRGASFTLRPDDVNAIGPGKRPLHTLIPAMAFRNGRPWLVFGTMGGDGQAQIHLQLLSRIVDDGADLQDAIDAPRWVVSPADWSVVGEGRFGEAWFEGLRARGHTVVPVPDHDWITGHAHAIAFTDDGTLGATDPRAEGAVLGP